MKTLKIDLDDVRGAGSVVKAVRESVAYTDSLLLADSSALGGQTFTTSGPGSGWTRTFDAGDYARAAIREDVAVSGCNPSESTAIDPEDGRWAFGVDPAEGDEWDGDIEWSDESCVELVCPSEEDALAYPLIAAQMAQAVIDCHGDRSDRKEWAKLLRTLRAAAEAVEDIDADELEG